MYHDKISRLLKVFGTPENLYRAKEGELINRSGLDKKEIRILLESREKFDTASYLAALKNKGIHIVTVEDEDYPKKMLPYSEKPYWLFYKGSLPNEDVPAVAMVGARACSGYGRKTAKKIAEELSSKGISVISGMARGIDTYSALGALEGGTPSYAVLGSGIDYCYPSENIELYSDLCKKGGIISEYGMGEEPLAWHFPQRNRIISGLADLIIVVEATEKSGSLITVEWALEQGKDVMAVPGRIDDRLSSGCNRLIKAGAEVFTSAKDVADSFYRRIECSMFGKENKGDASSDRMEKILEKDLALVYSELGLYPKSIFELTENTGLEYSTLTERLLQLQLMGIVEEPVKNYYAKTK